MPNAVWVYSLGQPFWDNAVAIERIRALGFDWVFLSINAKRLGSDFAYCDQAADFVVQARQHGIAVHAMTLEDPVFALAAHHSAALAHVDRLRVFNAAFPMSAFAGIHLDTEPHALPAWAAGSDREREQILQQYVALLAGIRGHLTAHAAGAGQALVLSAAIGWWYQTSGLPSGQAARLASQLDLLVPMVYDGIGQSTGDIIGRVQATVRLAPTMIGLAAREFPTYTALRRVVAELQAYPWSPPAHFRGTAIFRYEALPSSSIPVSPITR